MKQVSKDMSELLGYFHPYEDIDQVIAKIKSEQSIGTSEYWEKSEDLEEWEKKMLKRKEEIMTKIKNSKYKYLLD